jgi:hypothetical protein
MSIDCLEMAMRFEDASIVDYSNICSSSEDEQLQNDRNIQRRATLPQFGVTESVGKSRGDCVIAGMTPSGTPSLGLWRCWSICIR